jgi:hypothetical protein
MSDRTITKGVPEDWPGLNRCSWIRRRPFYDVCTNVGQYLMVVRIAATPTRRAHEMRYLYCEEHRPEPPQSEPPEPDMIGAEEAASIIGVPAPTFQGWRTRGTWITPPQSVKVKGKCWYRRPEVEHFAEAFRIVRGGSVS